MTDPIADMITRIRNGYLVNKAEVAVPYSRFKQALGDLLVREGYLAGVEKIALADVAVSPRTSKRALKRGRSDMLRLVLKYGTDGKPAASGLERVSKPSRRVYVGKEEVPIVRSGIGMAVISTSNGLMSNREARKAGLGGEIICELH